ncbi:MAG: Fur family transcriptional regulator [Roseiflexaceae bacterium]
MSQSTHHTPDMVQHALDRMSAAGYKMTAPRLAVLKAANTYDGSFSAADLEKTLHEHGTPLGDASLFRTLKLMTDIGIMQRIHGIDECHRYIISPDSHAHRVVCTTCGGITEFAECGLDSVISQLEQQTGYQIVDHLLELFGTCPHCQQTKSSPT